VAFQLVHYALLYSGCKLGDGSVFLWGNIKQYDLLGLIVILLSLVSFCTLTNFWFIF